MGSSGGRHRVWRMLLGLLAVSLVAAACGDDGDDGGSAGPSQSQAEPTDADQPVQGGDVTILTGLEIASLDPVRATGSGASDAQRFFPIYGALVTYDPQRNRTVGYFAESLDPDNDYTVWTLQLREGIEFSDGSPYDADAVRINWERLGVPENRSPALGIVRSIASVEVTDPLTLRITLQQANAHFPNSVSRSGLNYIASPTAIAAGVDLGAEPVGAGPFLLDRWVRDDRMTLVRNPGFVDAPRPYIDSLTLRIVSDERARLDTFLSGDAHANYVTSPQSVADGLAGGAAGYEHIVGGTGFAMVFNTSVPPFNDVRVRRAFVLALDRATVSEAVYGEEAEPSQNYSRRDTPWYTDEGALPDYDPDEAQRLFSEVAADTGAPVSITLQAFQTSGDASLTRFIQAALNQLDDVSVEIETNDGPTAIGNVLSGQFQASSWGFPYIDPDPGLFNAVRSGLPTNVSRYANAEVDAALDAARRSTDEDERAELYAKVYAAMARDLPFWPFTEYAIGYLHDDQLRGIQLWEDGILRSDLVWLEN